MTKLLLSHFPASMITNQSVQVIAYLLARRRRRRTSVQNIFRRVNEPRAAAAAASLLFTLSYPLSSVDRVYVCM